MQAVAPTAQRPNRPAGPNHLDVLAELAADSAMGANLVVDAHLAVLAIEHQAELHSNDTDFSRFSGLRWRNPIA